MTSRVLASLAVLASFSTCVLFAPAASAEAGRAPPRCEIWVTPGNGTLVPANVPALVALPTAANEGSLRVTVTSLISLDDSSFAGDLDRSPDSRVPGATLFAPTATYPVGATYEAAFDANCDGIGTKEVARFAAGEPADLPTAMGTLTTRAGSTANTAELLIDPTPELRAFFPVTMFDIETRKGTVLAARYGEAKIGDGERIAVAAPGLLPLTLCEANVIGDHVEKMSLRAHVAGAMTDPSPIAFDMTISCNVPQPTPPESSGREGIDETSGCSTAPDGRGSSRSVCSALFGCALLGALLVLRAARGLHSGDTKRRP